MLTTSTAWFCQRGLARTWPASGTARKGCARHPGGPQDDLRARLLRRLERLHVVGEGPALVLGERVGVRGHGGAVDPGGEAHEDVRGLAAALHEPALLEIGGTDGVLRVVLQGRRRGPVAPAALAVALPALGLLVDLPAPGEQLRRSRGPAPRAHHGARLLERGAERLEVCDHLPTLVGRERRPAPHPRPPDPPPHHT